MKRLITLLLVVSFLPGFSQSADDLVKNANIHFISENYGDAFRKANEALKSESEITHEKNVCKIRYIRAKSAMELVKSGSSEATYKDLIVAGDDILIVESMGCKTSKTDVNTVKVELHALYQRLGLGFLNQSYSNNLTPADRKTLFTAAVEVLSADVTIQPDEYMTYDLMAQAKLGLQDSVKAYDDFCKAVELHAKNLPAVPDQLIAYAYYRKALLERYGTKDLDAALNTVSKGEEILDNEHERVIALGDKFTDQQIAQYKQQYKDAKADLSAFRLDIYLNSPDKYNEALADFENAIKENPKNYMIHVAYGSLLEQTDKKKAEEMYYKAIAIDDNKAIAHFNLAALYMNEASAAAKKSNAAESMDEADKHMATMKTHMEKAHPHLVKSNELDPCDHSTLSSLMSIALNLELMDDFKKYKEMKTNCGF